MPHKFAAMISCFLPSVLKYMLPRTVVVMMMISGELVSYQLDFVFVRTHV